MKTWLQCKPCKPCKPCNTCAAMKHMPKSSTAKDWGVFDKTNCAKCKAFEEWAKGPSSLFGFKTSELMAELERRKNDTL